MPPGHHEKKAASRSYNGFALSDPTRGCSALGLDLLVPPDLKPGAVMPDFTLETSLGALGGRRVIGLDEAGRGPWAGPVVAAAVWLDPARLDPELLGRLDDSKKLSRAARERVWAALQAVPGEALGIGLGEASVAEIDRHNILQASLLAMSRAADALAFSADAALVDGTQAPALDCPVTCVVKGDGRSWSIAAASIAAKVTRDRQMAALSRRHPGYGWERNQGYGTAEHRAALARLGVSDQHRRSFRPIREALTLTH